MGRIVTPVRIENALDSSRRFLCDALVDTRASHLVLPTAWKDRLDSMALTQEVDMETATPDTIKAEIRGPVKIQIEGFRPIHPEVMFVEMRPEDGR